MFYAVEVVGVSVCVQGDQAFRGFLETCVWHNAARALSTAPRGKLEWISCLLVVRCSSRRTVAVSRNHTGILYTIRGTMPCPRVRCFKKKALSQHGTCRLLGLLRHQKLIDQIEKELEELELRGTNCARAHRERASLLTRAS